MVSYRVLLYPHSQAIVLVVWHHPSSRTREPLRCQAWKYWKEKEIQTIKMTKFSNSIICSINEPNLWFLYALFKLSLYNCDGNKYYCIIIVHISVSIGSKNKYRIQIDWCWLAKCFPPLPRPPWKLKVLI